MNLRKREYLSELTTSGVISGIVKPFSNVNRRVIPSTILGVVDRLKKLSRSLKLKPVKKKRQRDYNSQLRGLM